METKSLNEIKEKVDLKELDNLPETIEDIENNPILKPLIEFHKQASMLEKEDKIEANFLKDIQEDIKADLTLGIYDNSYIVKKYKNLEKEYERLVLIYSRYTDLADEKIIELKRIVEKYYITKKNHASVIFELRKEIEILKKPKEIKEIPKPKEAPKDISPKEDRVYYDGDGNSSEDVEEELSNEKPTPQKKVKKKEVVEEEVDDEKEYLEYLARKGVKK